MEELRAGAAIVSGDSLSREEKTGKYEEQKQSEGEKCGLVQKVEAASCLFK